MRGFAMRALRSDNRVIGSDCDVTCVDDAGWLGEEDLALFGVLEPECGATALHPLPTGPVCRLEPLEGVAADDPLVKPDGRERVVGDVVTSGPMKAQFVE
jgi:hypothetical protein